MPEGQRPGRRVGRRGWPWYRAVSGLTGVTALLVATVGPLESAADTSFVAHAVAHVLLGMLGPLLLVLTAPVTLALRTLPVPAARRLSWLLARRPVRLLTEPSVAVALAVGGLWVLYLTPLYALSREHQVVHLLVHLHLLTAGYLLAAALVGPDPAPHRRSPAHRAVVLVAAVAGHDILAKYLYGHPPLGVATAAAESGAMVMYYAGDAVEVAMMVLLCADWARRGVKTPRVPARFSVGRSRLG
ncbi:cytochrome c oxidase assembly protein [uncultured Friedmanniella sp.]|uniref:cytochrome c oxidase assembly protein n=1 Tax=uncultured Friedmanniella sp. TaxID=335381 RepID=UPI0035C9552B